MKKVMQWMMVVCTGLVLAACGQGAGSSSSSDDPAADSTTDKPSIVSTTTHITDLLHQLAGDDFHIEGLMGVGVDPHGYQPSASDVNKLQEADVAAYHGLHLEGQMGDVFDQLNQQGKTSLQIADALSDDDLIKTEEGEVDPHIWFSVPLWAKVTDYLSQQLAEVNPDQAKAYRQQADDYAAELMELDGYIQERVAEIPEESRYLVTAHDAFSYFGREYGFEVVGLQGISTETEAGTADLARLADFIVDHQIKAIFVESSVPERTVQALQEAVADRGFEVKIGGELYSDSLGEGDASTYVGMYKANIDTIVDALK